MRRPWWVDMLHCRGMWATWAWILTADATITIFTIRWAIIYTVVTVWLMYEIIRVMLPKEKRWLP